MIKNKPTRPHSIVHKSTYRRAASVRARQLVALERTSTSRCVRYRPRVDRDRILPYVRYIRERSACILTHAFHHVRIIEAMNERMGARAMRARGIEWTGLETCVRILANASRSSGNARGMRDVHRPQKQDLRSLHLAPFVRPALSHVALNWHDKFDSECVITLSRYIQHLFEIVLKCLN